MWVMRRQRPANLPAARFVIDTNRGLLELARVLGAVALGNQAIGRVGGSGHELNFTPRPGEALPV